MRTVFAAIGVLAICAGLGWGLSYWLDHELRTAEERGRREVVRDFVQIRPVERATNAPGATAWLQNLLRERCTHLIGSEQDRQDCLAVLNEQIVDHAHALPIGLAGVDTALTSITDSNAPLLFREPVVLQSWRASRLCVAKLSVGDTVVAVTRPPGGWPCPGSSDGSLEDDPAMFIRMSAQRLAASVSKVSALQSSMVVQGFGRPELRRLYLMRPDGTLVALRLGRDGNESAHDYDAFAAKAQDDHAPVVASTSFFFHFEPGDARKRYTGVYVDITDLGLVTTLLQQLPAASGWDGVAAVDFSLPISWLNDPALALPSLPQRRAVVSPAGKPTWRGLSAAAASMKALDSDFRGVIERCAAGPAEPLDPIATCPGRDVDAHDRPTVVAMQIASSSEPAGSTWLVTQLPAPSKSGGWLLVVLPAVLVIVVGGVLAREHFALAQRRRLEAKTQAYGELMRVLDELEIGIATAEPSTDIITSATPPAVKLGLGPGVHFERGVLGGSDADRQHYHEMMRPGDKPRRSYGVHLKKDGAFTVIRSTEIGVALDSIPPLSAPSRSRIAVLLPLEKDDDHLLTRKMEAMARVDERKRLGGLFGHGVLGLTRLLAAQVQQSTQDELVRWLAHYIDQRVQLIVKLFAAPGSSHDPETAVGVEPVRNTLQRYGTLFEVIRDSFDLRLELGWDNSALSARSSDGRVIDIDLSRWPRDKAVLCPIEGALGFFLGEALVNAVRHGPPGSVPKVVAREAPGSVSRSLELAISNPTSESMARKKRGDEYGGTDLLDQLADRLGWERPSRTVANGVHTIAWRAPLVAWAQKEST